MTTLTRRHLLPIIQYGKHHEIRLAQHEYQYQQRTGRELPDNSFYKRIALNLYNKYQPRMETPT